jgi:hypothetical protein
VLPSVVASLLITGPEALGVRKEGAGRLDAAGIERRSGYALDAQSHIGRRLGPATPENEYFERERDNPN